jgi:hypothetical protein
VSRASDEVRAEGRGYDVLDLARGGTNGCVVASAGGAWGSGARSAGIGRWGMVLELVRAGGWRFGDQRGTFVRGGESREKGLCVQRYCGEPTEVAWWEGEGEHVEAPWETYGLLARVVCCG